MNYDKKRVAEVLQRREKTNNREALLNATAELLRQSAVKSELLTQDPVWDLYLTRIQKDIDIAEDQLATLRAKLEDPEEFSTETLVKLKSTVLQKKATIEALSAAIQYPKVIMEAQKKVKKLQ